MRVALPPLAAFDAALLELALCPPFAEVVSTPDELMPVAEVPPAVIAPRLSSFDPAHPHAAQTKIRASPLADVIRLSMVGPRLTASCHCNPARASDVQQNCQEAQKTCKAGELVC